MTRDRPRGVDDMFTDCGAVISRCQRYRSVLFRIWNRQRPAALFVMLNPSTADAREDDATIRRCRDYASAWGWGGVRVVNMYGWRATDPEDLGSAADPIGPENDRWIAAEARLAASAAAPVVCGWGNHGAGERAADVLALIRAAGAVPQCLRVTGAGQPQHPLYLPRGLMPFPYDERSTGQ